MFTVIIKDEQTDETVLDCSVPRVVAAGIADVLGDDNALSKITPDPRGEVKS